MNQDVEEKIRFIFEKWVPPMCEDLRRTLEVTCHFVGPDNHGSNFAGNLLVLCCIDFLSQFMDPTAKEEREEFEERLDNMIRVLQNKECKSFLEKQGLAQKDQKEIIDLIKHKKEKSGPRTDTDNAKEFMKKYFSPLDERYSKCADLIWKVFRQGHVHSFLPKSIYEIRANDGQEMEIGSGVHWAYAYFSERFKVGIRISALEEALAVHGREKVLAKFEIRHLECMRDEEDGSIYFCMCPQILFIDFKKAIGSFERDVRSNKDGMQDRFSQAFDYWIDRMKLKYSLLDKPSQRYISDQIQRLRLVGRWKGFRISREEIDELRREMWRSLEDLQ